MMHICVYVFSLSLSVSVSPSLSIIDANIDAHLLIYRILGRLCTRTIYNIYDTSNTWSKWIKMIGNEEMVWILWKLNVHFSTMTIRRLWHQCQLMKPNVLLCGLFIIHKAVPQLRKACECRKCCKGQLELILFYSSTLDSSLHQFGPCTGTLHTRPHYKQSANLQSSRPASQP